MELKGSLFCSHRLIPPYSALFDRLIPPYSVPPPASTLGSKTTQHLDRVRGSRPTQVSSNEADRHAKYGQPLGDRSERGYWRTGVPSHRRRPEESGAGVQ